MTKVEEKLEMLIEEIRNLPDKISESSMNPWMTSKEAARYLRCSVSKLEDLTSAGMIPFHRLDPRSRRSARLYHCKELATYLVTGRSLQANPLTASERRQVKELG